VGRKIVLLVLLAIGCKSWNKFWDTGSAASVITYSVNFGSQGTGYYAGYALWNDYVKNDGTPLSVTHISPNFTKPLGSATAGQTTRLNASATACSASQTGGYNTCIHAGMMRGFTITSDQVTTTCANISVTDSLSAFSWICDATVQPVRIASVGFREGKYLSDLIDFTAVAFRQMSITVTAGSQTFTSTPSVWWVNSVQNLPTFNYGVASGIYLVQSNPNYAAPIANLADKITLLVKPGIKVTTTSGASAINNAGRNFSWFEGTIDLNASGSGAAGFNITTGAYVVVQNFNIIHASPGLSASYQIGGRNGFFRDTRYSNATIASQRSYDLVAGSDANLLSGTHSSNDETAMTFNGTNNVLLNTTTFNSNSFTTFGATGANNAFVNYTLANTNSGGSGGVRFNFAGAAYNTFLNLNVANTPSPAVHFFSGSNYAQVINLAGAVNSATILNASASAYAYLGGTVSFGNGGALACGGGCAQCGFTVTCTPQDSSDFTIVNSTLSPASSFMGKVITDDTANSSDNNGFANYNLSLDWLNFSHRLRGYGIDQANPFPDVAHQGRCTTLCRIWDWTLRTSDTQYRNLLSVPTGTMVASHKWSAVAQVNCTQPGAVWYSGGTCDRPPYPGTTASCVAIAGSFSASGCFTTFLRNAYEILEDGIGNDNGLCESNEACIYTPNIASYQGHGSLTCIRGPAELGCPATFTNGTISNVVLYQYSTNGY